MSSIIHTKSALLTDLISQYEESHKMLVAVDCIIFGFDLQKLKLLLFKRKVEPFINEWSLIGSFVKQNESVSSSVARVLYESTGIEGVYLKELNTYGKPNRDPGGRVISIAHYALIRLDEHQERSVENYQAKWFDVNEIPPLIFDHNEMVVQAMTQLKFNARYSPLGFELLPEKFTIPQLQILYEAIYQRKLDRRNFRKKILSKRILIQLEEKDKSGSKKGAFLYQFDEAAYQELSNSGVDFQF